MGAGAVKVSLEGKQGTESPTTTMPNSKNNDRPNTNACEGCAANFTLTRRRKPCADCGRNHCSSCLMKEHTGRDAKRRCTKCSLLVSGTFTRKQLMELTTKDLRYFMVRKKISMENCTEKIDLVETLLRNSNNTHYQREVQDQQRHLEELQRRKEHCQAAFEGPRSRLADDTSGDIGNSSEGRGCSTEHSTNQALRVCSSSGTDHLRESDQSHSSIHTRHRETSQSQSSLHVNGANGSETVQSERLSQRNMHQFSPEQTSAPPSCDSDSVHNLPSNTDNNSSTPQHTAPQSQPPTTAASDANQPTEEMEGADATKQPSNAKKFTHVQDLASLESIEALSSRQLKEVLASSFVDYKGCCEKFELVERVKRLWQDKNDDVAKATSAGQDDLCKICMDAVIDCVLLDCGHMVACTRCGRQMAECPICRQYVVRVVHVFKA